MDNKWENQISEMSLDTLEMCYTLVGKSQAEMPWPGVVLVRSRNFQKGLGDPATFCNRNPKAETQFISVSVALPASAAPFILTRKKKKKPAMCSAEFQISSVSIISPCTSTKICYLAQIQQSKCSMPSSASLWVKPAWNAFWVQPPTFLQKRPFVHKAHLFFMIFKIAFMVGVTTCKGRSGGKPLSILHL